MFKIYNCTVQKKTCKGEICSRNNNCTVPNKDRTEGKFGRK